MNVGRSFTWPFQGPWFSRWVPGVVGVLLLPFAFTLLLGYAVECVRAADERPLDGLPSWRNLARIERYGRWMALALIVLTAPFAVMAVLLSSVLHVAGLWHSTGTLLDVEALVSAAFIVALPWGIVLLVLMPHATARFAVTQRVRDLFDFASSIRSVRRDFAAWNLAIAAIVTAWAVGVACAAVFCVGLAPGMFYAILVSAHATASLHPEGASPSPG